MVWWVTCLRQPTKRGWSEFRCSHACLFLWFPVSSGTPFMTVQCFKWEELPLFYQCRPPSQVMSPTTWPSASSTTLQVPSPTLHRHRTKTWMTWHSARCSQRHTEHKPITANQKACQSVSRRRLLCSMDQGTLMERNVDQSVNFGVTRNTYSAHSKFSENTQAEKVVDRSGKPVGARQLERTD